MRIYPAVHYTMGGLWVDYDLMSTVPGLFVIGEANFSDHGANRLGASALMQGLGDGYFILPHTLPNYLATRGPAGGEATGQAFREAADSASSRVAALLGARGKRTADSYHRQLGHLMWDLCGMERSEKSLREALARLPALRDEYWKNVLVPGTAAELNQSLEKALRVADFFELAELICIDALHRTESCGGHFRVESQTPDGEARRDDEHCAYAAAWEFTGDLSRPALHKEPLEFEEVHLAQRSYK